MSEHGATFEPAETQLARIQAKEQAVALLAATLTMQVATTVDYPARTPIVHYTTDEGQPIGAYYSSTGGLFVGEVALATSHFEPTPVNGMSLRAFISDEPLDGHSLFSFDAEGSVLAPSEITLSDRELFVDRISEILTLIRQ